MISKDLEDLNVVRIKLVSEAKPFDYKPISSPNEALKKVKEVFAEYDREYFRVLNLDAKGRIININIVSQGDLNSSVVHPREVFKSSILSNAAAMICFHNHPSGELTPSKEDFDITERLNLCGKLLGIYVLDHIIVAPYNDIWYSIRENQPHIFNSNKELDSIISTNIGEAQEKESLLEKAPTTSKEKEYER